MKFKFDKVNKHEFHEKFAWGPVKVDDESGKTTVVVFEKYIRRCTSEDTRRRKISWEQYSKKEYFKKKLKGDFEKSQHVEMGHDSTDAVFSFATDADTGMRKATVGDLRVAVGGMDQEIKLYDEHGNEVEEYD